MPSRAALSQARDYWQRHDRVRAFEQHSAKVHSVAWNCDGRRLASGSQDKRISVAQLDSCRLKTDFIGQGHTDQVDQVGWHQSSPDVLASAGGDKTVRIWDLRAKKGTQILPTKDENINVGWSPDGTTVAYGDKSDRISLVDTRMWKVSAWADFKTETNEFAWEPSGGHLFVGSGNGRLFVFKCAEAKGEMRPWHTIQAHPASSNCMCVRFDPSGEHFAVGGTDAVISIWQLRNLCCVRTIDRLDYPGRAVSFSHDSRLLASGSEDHCVDIAWVETGERVFELRSDAETYTLMWHPRQLLLAFACGESYRDGGVVKLFGLSSDQV